MVFVYTFEKGLGLPFFIEPRSLTRESKTIPLFFIMWWEDLLQDFLNSPCSKVDQSRGSLKNVYNRWKIWAK